ncbi:hypothetical protein EHS13_27245 [Paenibacillus psychroresistens]|uniref:Uncharacterized protein n=1 Tax=Paenibacillus psychroresistens TaxID=1778678 RepID=A0A6B8RSN4_9BACL|nr:hypothetical protein [Paenibacillus psychroresistens]QGQ98316.1 hypothetical protein EHS13_27245 [Paenibacillus psychroresistens]
MKSKKRMIVSLGMSLAVIVSNSTSVFAATKTVDFNNFPINYTHVNWQLPVTHTSSTGFSYSTRIDQHGVTWPTTAYYDQLLGAGGYNTVNGWNMKSMILYATEKNNAWLSNGWNYYQDMAEGATCVDDSARSAIAFAEDYILNGTSANAASFQNARDLLTFTGYMTTLEGKVYNFAWLDGPGMFGWDPIQQGQDKHFNFRSEYVKRTEYPFKPGQSPVPNRNVPEHFTGYDWMDPETDDAHALHDASNKLIPARPFMPHSKYSIYMNDLQSTSGADIAQVYSGVLYNANGTENTANPLNGIKQDWTTSSLNLGADDARNLWAFAEGLNMMQKYKSINGSLTGDNLNFAKFLEAHINRLLYNIKQYNLSTLDVKLASNFLTGLTEYYQLIYGSTTNPGSLSYGTYAFNLPANSNTTSVYDDRITQNDIYVMMDALQTRIISKQFHTSDWRDGIFIDDSVAGNWGAWGELEIYALSKQYILKRNAGQTPTQLNSLLDSITYSADRFYANQAYHYNDSSNNYARTKERITSITGWAAKFHTNDSQVVYANSSIALGLKQLAEAYYLSGRADITTKRSNYLEYAKRVASWFIGNNNLQIDLYDAVAGAGTYKGQGTVFDGIAPARFTGIITKSNDTGGESNAEGLLTLITIKKAIAQYGLSSSFSFNY